MAVFILIFLLLTIAYLAIMEHYSRWWHKTATITDAGHASVHVSIIVPVRNEQDRIGTLLNAIEKQNYPLENLEIIVVDDHSTDETVHVILSHSLCSRIRLLHLPPHTLGKKAAITLGVQHSAGELIVTTDADCSMGPLWIAAIATFYSNTGAKFIAAPVMMTSRKTISGIFQRLDFLTMQGITCASVQSRMHCMCNGANLAYERKAFIEVNGFEGIDELPTGDDMLLMYKIFKKYPHGIAYLKSYNAIVYTPAEPGWRSFLQQRIRWASKAAYYGDRKIMLVLLVTYLLNVSFAALVVLSFLYSDYAWLLLMFFAMKIVIEMPFVYSVCKFFGQQRLIYLFPLLQPLHIMYIILAGWLGQFGSYRWKSRTIKNKRPAKLVKQ